MLSPFAEHAQNTADYFAMLKGDGSGGAVLTFSTFAAPLAVDCTYDRIQDGFDLIPGGQSPKLLVEGCTFLLSQIPATQRTAIRKGLKCSLKPNPAAAAVPVQLWTGGLEQGGLKYRFMLVDANYSA